MNLAELPPTLTVLAAAEILGISRNSGYKGVATGQIPALRIARRWIVPTALLLEMLGINAHEADTVGIPAAEDPDAEVSP